MNKRLLCLLLSLLVSVWTWADNYAEWYGLPTSRLVDMGRSYTRQNRADSAMLCYRIVCHRYEQHPSAREVNNYALALNNSGILFTYHYFDFPQAYKNLIKARDLADRYQLDSTMAVVVNNLVDLLSKYQNDYPSSALSQECVDLAIQGFDCAYRTQYWGCLSTIFINLSDSRLDLDLKPFARLLDPAVPDSATNVTYARHLYHAIEASSRGEYRQAREHVRRNFEASVYYLEHERYDIANYRYLADFACQDHCYDEALSYLDSALVLIDQYGNADGQARIYETMTQIHQLRGDTLRRDQCHLLCLEARDRQNQLSNMQSLIELSFLHQIGLEEQRIVQLDQRQRLLSRTLIVTLIVLALLGTLCLVIYRQKRRLADLNRSLYDRIQHEIAVTPVVPAASANHTLPDGDRKDDLWQRILDVLDDTQMICSPDFSLSMLANAVASNVTYVSAIVNERSGQNFSSLLNERRIREACRRMNDIEQYGRYTIEAISTSLGFKSRVTFVNAFKRQLSLTPSEYMRIARQRHEQQREQL